jgi:hypothetical protein
MKANDAATITRLLDVIEHDIVPKTAEGVSHGNKLFGAAILNKATIRWSSPRPTMRWKIRSGTAKCTA